MATTATARSEPDLYGRIAAPLHTILVLAAQGALVVRGVIRADQARAMASMNRMTMYERTILSEWLTGHRNCGCVLDWFHTDRFDFWLARAQWGIRSGGAIPASTGRIRNVGVDRAFDHSRNLRGGDLSGVLPAAVHGADEERSHGNSAFRSGVWSSALLPGAWRGGSDRIARRAAGDSGQLAKKRASGNDCPRVGRYFRWSACPFDEDQSRLTAVG